MINRSPFDKYTKKKRQQEWKDFLAYNPRVIIFHTDTSGLDPDFNEILSLSWLIIDAKTWDIQEVKSYYFPWPGSIYVDEEAIEINGLTIAELCSYDISSKEEVLKEFAERANTCDLAVGHNIMFDIIFLIAANPKLKNILNKLKKIDTMDESREFCKIHLGFGYKSPKLSELANRLHVGVDKYARHSLYNTLLIFECFKKIAETGCIYLPEKYLIEITAPGYDKENPILSVRKEKGKIPYYAFQNWHSIKEAVIPEGIEIIGNHAFFRCINLEKITLPKSLKTIEEAAFAYCKNLIHIELPKNIQYIGPRAFAHCSKLEEIEIPPKVSYLGDEAFAYCPNIKNMVIPDSVISTNNPRVIVDHPLYNKSIFFHCPKNRTELIVIPDGITSIAEYAFQSCELIKEIIVPASVKYIGRMAFAGCKSLEKLNIPDDAVIKAYAFDDCPLSEVYNDRVDNMEITLDNFFEYDFD